MFTFVTKCVKVIKHFLFGSIRNYLLGKKMTANTFTRKSLKEKSADTEKLNYV